MERYISWGLKLTRIGLFALAMWLFQLEGSWPKFSAVAILIIAMYFLFVSKEFIFKLIAQNKFPAVFKVMWIGRGEATHSAVQKIVNDFLLRSAERIRTLKIEKKDIDDRIFDFNVGNDDVATLQKEAVEKEHSLNEETEKFKKSAALALQAGFSVFENYEDYLERSEKTSSTGRSQVEEFLVDGGSFYAKHPLPARLLTREIMEQERARGKSRRDRSEDTKVIPLRRMDDSA